MEVSLVPKCRTGLRFSVFVALAFLAVSPAAARAEERLCDPSFENCRTPLLALINNERVGIDAAFWFMEDSRYANAIIGRWKAGVPVRLLVDPRTTASLNKTMLQMFKDAGVPMRYRIASGIMHWKMMLFAGQRVVEFGSANYSVNALVPVDPYRNYVDETIFFTDDPALVNSFMTKFDSSWIDTVSFRNYANVTTLTKRYPVYPIAPEVNFVPGQSFANRSVKLYNAEPAAIDVIMYRVTDVDHTNAIIAARQRGVPVRLIHEPTEYRNPARLWDSWNIDRMWSAGVQVRIRAHAGLNHQKSVILYGLRTVIFGSSNWTGASDTSQQEHNYFVQSKPWMFTWFVTQFGRKWTNTNPLRAAETKAFTPLPPDVPKNKLPLSSTSRLPRTGLKLKWYGGPWAHTYDVYFGTTSPPPLYAANLALGPSESSSQQQSFTLPTLPANSTFYWRIVAKTAAQRTAVGSIWTFATGS
jgi:phosphatidylserine/phosphatidylglycerophosphate/cardiolipin synthase-like enzyme